MENLFLSVAEKTILGAGFFYLLYYLVKNMDAITVNLGDFGCTLKEISHTLVKIDMRVEQLEGRVKDLEKEGRL